MNSRWVKSESILDNDNNNSNYGSSPFPRPGGPLKPRIEAVQKKIEMQISRLEELQNVLKLKDNDIFCKLVVSISEKNTQHSIALSSELARTRQISRVVLLSHIILEKIVARLSSPSGFGDIVVVLSPTMAIVKNLRSSLTPHVPEMEEEFGIISELLSGILVDAGQVGGYTINFEVANKEAVRIIEEASLVIDQKMKEDLPGIPELPAISLNL